MKIRKIKDDVFCVGAVDWDRRLFDSLIPLPDGTSYNAYIVKGSEKIALLDTVDPTMLHILMEQLNDFPKIDYIIAHHVEQDHSGAIPVVLEKYKDAVVLCSTKAKPMMSDHLHVSESRIRTVVDGESLSLGNKTLRFFDTPWVHWPETMITHLVEDKIVFTCDFFGAHLATSDIFVTNEGQVYEAAKRYYAEIMMPFRAIIKKNVEKVESLHINTIAPSHGPVYNNPKFIIEAYKEWVSDQPKNLVVIPYISMHGSTKLMVEHLVSILAANGVQVQQFDMATIDLGKLAISLVDAATLILATPTVLVGPHPSAVYAAVMANALRPKLKFAGIIGSYAWGGKTVEMIASAIPNLKAELFEPIMIKGLPRPVDFERLDALARLIIDKHVKAGLL